MNSIQEIADRLVEYCREAKWEEAQRALYAPDARSIEAQESPAFAKETGGLEAIVEKGHKFSAMVEQYHGLAVSAPIVADNSFACTMTLDATMKGMGRVKMTEVCVYEVKDGKIVTERFFP